MVSVFMITDLRRPVVRVVPGVPGVPGVVVAFAALSCLAAMACQRVALLAPTGSTITLTALSSALPLSGSTNIIAQVIEPAGTPPQRGTLITFTTSLGSIEPVEA